MAPPSDVDGLFQLQLADYTAARNALAARLKAAGHAEDAGAVKALPKPSPSAWTVNQLYWHHRKAFNELMASGQRLRNAQASKLAGRGSDLRGPIEAHRAALREALTRAAALFHDAGQAPTRELTRRIATTLDALTNRDRRSFAPPDGRLTHDMDPLGFESLAPLVPRQAGALRGTGRSRVIPFRHRAEPNRPKKLDAAERQRVRREARKAQLRAAAAALSAAERASRDARKAAARAESVLRRAAARVKVAEKAKAGLEKRIEKAAAVADAARQDARRVAAAAEEAAQAIADAEHARGQARRALDLLS